MENRNILKKTLKIALFVSLASLVRFELINGFLVAMSVLIMGIFIYCYEDLSALYIACCSAVFAPLLRILTLEFSSHNLYASTMTSIPDMVFFVSYGIVYTLIYKYLIKAPKTIKNFPYVAFFSDFLANIMELLTRCLILRDFFLDITIIGALILIVVCRTVLLQMILLAMETYSNLLVNEEHDKEYHRLIEQASIFESELYLMEKNSSEIEDIMKRAYGLYKSMDKFDIPDDIKKSALEVAKNAHEIKGDYLNIIRVLTDTFVDEFEKSNMSIRDLIAIEKANVQSVIREKNYNIDLHFRLRTDFYVKAHFKMMSLIRNLLLNAVEAIGEKGGMVSLNLLEIDDNYVLKIKDNGPGINKEDLDDIFLDGYSTKFNEKTGDIQRGVGLTVVKDYVENYFKGSITVRSAKGAGTEFIIILPKKNIGGEEKNELLPD